MQLSIEPKFVARRPARSRLAAEAKSFTTTFRAKKKTAPLYGLALVVGIGILGTILFYAFTFWPW